MEPTTHALKEWSIAINALEQGKTITLLRKGGIREQGNRFQVAYNQVLLYPTYEHQQPSLLKAEYRQLVKPVESGWHPETVRIGSWAEITDIFAVHDESKVAALQPFLIWNDQFVSDRLKWKANQPLYVLLLRTYQLPQVHHIPYQTEYGSCKSWIDLIEPISTPKDLPVLNDREYLTQVNLIRQVIA